MNKEQRLTSGYLARNNRRVMTPKGMGDVLPPFAAQRRALSRHLLEHISLSGYDLVTPPLLEHAAVVALGLDLVNNPRDLMRFVEPDTGEVAVLRPDITPQVARIVATRLRDRPPPYRLCYEGRIVRRRRGRARLHRQLAQVGVECIGIPSPAGDVETVSLAAEACAQVGLRAFRVELCTSALVLPILNSLPQEARHRVAEHLGSKDGAALRATGHEFGLDAGVVKRLEMLMDHYGDLSVLDSAVRAFGWPEAQAALAELQTITDGLTRSGLGNHLCVDLGETRGLTYYTGASFQILAEGPGEAICSGGRYDNLLGQIGEPYPATGFALNVEHLQWALRNAGAPYAAPRPVRFVVVLDHGAAGYSLVQALRATGLVAATLPYGPSPEEALAFARCWGYDAIIVPGPGGVFATRVVDGVVRTCSALDHDAVRELARWASSPASEG